MPAAIQLTFALLKALGSAIVDLLTGRRRRRYETSAYVQAPRDVVWSVAAAKSISFDGLVPIEIRSTERADGSGIVDSRIRFGDREGHLVYRIVEERPDEALLIELMEDGTDRFMRKGNDYYAAVTLAPEQDGTRLTLVHELTHTDASGRLTVPLAIWQNARRMKHHAEKLAGVQPPEGAAVRAALFTGALTFASFYALWGWSAAAMLIALLLVHELGHVIAMRWVGIPVKGIYFIPFFGGVAVGAARRSAAENGFVALMGPGFSVVTTALLVFAAKQTGNPELLQLAVLSAFLNGLNLLPIVPLDGGQVLAALMSRLEPSVVSLVHMIALMCGIGFAAYMEWWVLVGFLLLGLPFVLSSRQPRHLHTPITAGQGLMLGAGYLSSLVFYVATIARLLGETA